MKTLLGILFISTGIAILLISLYFTAYHAGREAEREIKHQQIAITLDEKESKICCCTCIHGQPPIGLSCVNGKITTEENWPAEYESVYKTASMRGVFRGQAIGPVLTEDEAREAISKARRQDWPLDLWWFTTWQNTFGGLPREGW